MITTQAKERTRMLAFWEKHGTKAAIETFQVSRRTLFYWQLRLHESHGQLDSLNARSRSTTRKRQRFWDERIVAELKRIRGLDDSS